MPDFRAQQRDTSGIQKAYSRSKTADFLNTGMAGVESGMQLAESMRVMKEKRQRAKQMAEIMQSPEVKDSIVKLGVNPELFMASLQQDPTGTLRVLGDLKKNQQPTNTNINLQTSGGIAGIDTLFGGGQPEQSTLIPKGYQANKLDKFGKPTGYERVKESPKVDTTAIEIADAIERGDQSPELGRLYKYAGPVRAELGRRGFDLVKAGKDWQAITKTINGLNSTQQVRMRQALDSVELSIPELLRLNDELKKTGLPDVNWAMINSAVKRGVGPQKDLATQYIGQINLMKDELAQGFMGGGVPTDRAFKLAEDILQPFYGNQQFEASIKQLGYNLAIRKKAMKGITALTVGGDVNNPRMEGKNTLPPGGQPQGQPQNDDPMGLFK